MLLFSYLKKNNFCKFFSNAIKLKNNICIENLNTLAYISSIKPQIIEIKGLSNKVKPLTLLTTIDNNIVKTDSSIANQNNLLSHFDSKKNIFLTISFDKKNNIWKSFIVNRTATLSINSKIKLI